MPANCWPSLCQHFKASTFMRAPDQIKPNGQLQNVNVIKTAAGNGELCGGQHSAKTGERQRLQRRGLRLPSTAAAASGRGCPRGCPVGG